MSEKKTKKNTESKPKKGIGAFLKDEKFKITLGLIILFFAALLTVAFTSYFFTWNVDQSKEWNQVLSPSTEQVDNWSGKTGAKLADFFINRGIGITAFCIPFMLFILGLR